MKLIRLIAVALWACSAFAAPHRAVPMFGDEGVIVGKVTRVSDGDTIHVTDGSNFRHKIRLVGIDAPVCDDWPYTGFWLSTNSDARHNRNCENYRKTRGYPCTKDEGRPCGKCGG